MQVIHAGDEDQTRRAREALTETRRTLYRILAQDGESQPGGQGGNA
jgi:hypothetical protein